MGEKIGDFLLEASGRYKTSIISAQRLYRLLGCKKGLSKRFIVEQIEHMETTVLNSSINGTEHWFSCLCSCSLILFYTRVTDICTA